jgi:hypothetical protein
MTLALVFGDDVDAVHLDVERPHFGGARTLCHGRPPQWSISVHDCLALSSHVPGEGLDRAAGLGGDLLRGGFQRAGGAGRDDHITALSIPVAEECVDVSGELKVVLE